MAARNPTSWTEYVDEEQLQPGAYILSAEPSNVVNDQTYILDCPQMVISDCWYPREMPLVGSYTNGTYQEIYRTWAICKDMCSEPTAPSTLTYQWAVYAWASDASDFTVRLTRVGAATTSTVAVTSGHTTPSWRGLTNHSFGTDGAEEQVLLEISRDSGSGNVFCCGLILVAPES